MIEYRTATATLGLPLTAVLAAACAATSVKTDYDRRADFARYRTYAIRSGPVVREADAEDLPPTVVHDRVLGALAHELAELGMAPAGQGRRPDVIITYSVTAERDPELVETVGGDPNWRYGGYNVFPRDVDRGTLVIDVIDADAKKLVWRSIARAEDEEVRSSEFIERAVEKAMKQFPPGASS
jgi:hypothetical protein